MNSDELEILLKTDWISGLSQRARDGVLAGIRIRHYSPDAEVFCEGDDAKAYYGILTGAVNFSKVTRDGKQSLLTQLIPPHWFGELSFIDGGPRMHDAHAIGDLILATIDKVVLKTLMTNHDDVRHAMVSQLSKHTRMLYAAVDDLLLMSPERLLAKRVLERYEATGAKIQINQDELARLVGVSRQSINRILGIWESNGSIKRVYGGIVVLNITRLQSAVK